MANNQSPNHLDEREMVAMLRKEAGEVKDCFTRFSFQAIAFTSVLLGIVFRYLFEHPFVSLASIPVIGLLLAVSRIGIYKYGTANRNYGYELYLNSARHFNITANTRWQPHMKQIGWEEALRAWRIVQASMFKHIYVVGMFRFNRLRKKHKKELKYKWFAPKALIKDKAHYHAGTYLKTMLAVLHTLVIFSFTPLVMGSYLIYVSVNQNFPNLLYPFIITAAVFWLLLTSFVFNRIMQDHSRRKILEGGLLCIHSCSIIWPTVVVTHYQALEALRNQAQSKGVGFRNYTEYLAEVVYHFLKEYDISDIHYWFLGDKTTASSVYSTYQNNVN